MKKGQVFTIDMFVAYGVFFIVFLLIMSLSVALAAGIFKQEKVDEFTRGAITGADYLVYHGDFTDRPYEFNKSEIDWFFAQSEGYIGQTLQFSHNFSIKVQALNGTTLLSAGNEIPKPKMALSFERVVRYNDDDAKLVVVLWEKLT